MKRHPVRDIMTTDVVAVTAQTPYKEIAQLLTQHHISAVPVVGADRYVLGVVSEADLMYKIEFAGRAPAAPLFERRRERVARVRAAGTTASSLMTAPAVTVLCLESVTAAARRMDAARVKRLPVVDERGRLVGIVSRADLLAIYLRADADIEAEIRQDVLARTLWQRPDVIDVSVSEGVATLAGCLDRRSTLPLFVRLVEGIPGVVSVVSHLSYHYDDSRDTERAPVALLTRPGGAPW